MKTINGYKLLFNSFWNMWHVSHDEIGFCGSFTNEQDAVEYCEKG
jgi:hypothetical protein